jgi:hypothetical protein
VFNVYTKVGDPILHLLKMHFFINDIPDNGLWGTETLAESSQNKHLCLHVHNYFNSILYNQVGRYSSVGIETRYGLEGPEIESRWGQMFQNGPGAHPASCTHPNLAPKLEKEQNYNSTPRLDLRGLFGGEL